MKKLFFILLAGALFFASCQKEDKTPLETYVALDVTNLGQPGNDNGTKDDIVSCSDSVPDYAEVVINGDTNYVDVFYDNYGNLHTKVCKIPLPDGAVTGTLTSFKIYHDVAPAGPGPEDILVSAAPANGSEYQQYVDNQLDIEFEVQPFYKTILNIDVLCYNPQDIEGFGFLGSNIGETELDEICLFGDLCIDTACFAGSIYEQQQNGLEYDVPAIMQVSIINSDGDTIGFADNMDWLGEGAPLCVQFPDDPKTVDDYTLSVDIWLPTSDGFGWTYVGQLSFTDNGQGLNTGDDGILDFVLGDCDCEGDYVWAQGCINYDPPFVDSVMFYGVKITDDTVLPYYQVAWGGYVHFYNPVQDTMNASTWIYLVHNGLVIANSWSDGNDCDSDLTGNNGYMYYYANNSCDVNTFKIQLNWVKMPNIMNNEHMLANVQRQPDWNFTLTGNEEIPKGANGKCNMIWYPESYVTPVGDWQKTNTWNW